MLTKDNYFSDDSYLHSTQIKTYLDSPYLYKLRYVDKNPDFQFVPTTAVNKGSAVDAILTEGTAIDDIKLTPAERRDVALYVSQIPEHPIWQHLKASAEFQKIVEGELAGAKVCSKLDAVTNDAIYDLKVSSKNEASTPDKWLWHCRKLRYPVQAAVYQALEGNDKPFYHLVAYLDNGLVEMRLYRMPQTMIYDAVNDVVQAIEGIKAEDFKRNLCSLDSAIELPYMSQTSEQEDEDSEW